jgi:hypothetical protein
MLTSGLMAVTNEDYDLNVLNLEWRQTMSIIADSV